MKFNYVLIFLSVLSCKGTDHNNTINSNHELNSKQPDTTDKQSDTTRNLTLYEFLDAIKTRGAPKYLNFLSAEKTFPIDWIKASDVDTLMSLIESKEKCRCILNPGSSYIPINEKADLGGYAILLLNSYKHKESVGFNLWACPKTDKAAVANLLNWNKSIKK
jgi:hypothetical protein